MKKLSLFLLGVGLLIPNKCYASALTATATGGQFNAGASWVGGVAPVDGDTLTIPANSTITYTGGTITLGTALVGNVAMAINGTFDIPYDCPSSTIIFAGHCQILDGASGLFTIGSSANPYLSTNTVRMYLSAQNTARPKMSLHQNTLPGSVKWYGSYYQNNVATTTTKTVTSNFAYQSSSQVSCVADVDAQPGQQYMISCTHAPTDTELLTVASYDRATSSITFTTNFLYIHAPGAPIALVSMNIVLMSTNTTTAMFFNKEANTSLVNSAVLIWDKVEYNGLGGLNGQGSEWLGNYITITNSSFYNCAQLYYYAGTGMIMTNCVIGRQYGNSQYLLNMDAGGVNATISNCYFLGANPAQRLILDGAGDNTYKNCWFTGAPVVFYLNGTQGTQIIDSSMTCISNAPYMGSSGVNEYKATNFNYVQLSTNVSDANTPNTVHQANAAYKNLVVTDDNCSYYPPSTSTPTTSGGYVTRVDFPASTIIKVANFQKSTGYDRFYNNNSMVFRDTDTYRTTAPSLKIFTGAYSTQAYLVIPTSVTFILPCNTGDTVLFRGYVYKNSSYGSITLPAISLVSSDGSLNTNSTMSNISDTWTLLTGYGTIATTGTVTVSLVAQSTITNSATWFDDCRVYVGNNVYALGKVWVKGYPQSSPVATTVDTANLWNATTSGYSAGTMGYNVGTNLDGKISDIAVDVTPILTAINTSSNTLSSQISGISISTTPIVNAVWGKTIYSTKSASETLREIRRREP